MANVRTLALAKLRHNNRAMNQLDNLVDTLRDATQGFRSRASSVAPAIFALESIDEGQMVALDDAMQDLQVSLESAVSTTVSDAKKVDRMYTSAQREASLIAGVLAGDVARWRNQPTRVNFANEAFTTNVDLDQIAAQGPVLDKRIPAFEAYDEKENRDVVVYSMAYNLQASRQNDFGEAFFPTLTVSPDNVGFDISVRLINVFDGDLRRDISGAVNDFQRRNVIRAMIDWTILRNDSTRIVPVHRAETAAHFVAPTDVAPANVLVGRETVLTAPLKVGERFSLLGISSTPALIANGLLDSSDAIDTAPVLKNVYVKVVNGADTDVLRLDVTGFATNNFVSAVQGQHRLMTLNFSTDGAMLNKDKKRADGSAMVALADIATNDVIVYLSLNMSGQLDLQTATTEVFGNRVTVAAVKDASGNPLSLTSAGVGQDIANLFAAATIIGYDIEAYRTNSNRRQRGDQLETMYWRQRYAVPLLSPITVARPVSSDGQTDTSDLGALITTTQVRASNAAVTTLLNTASMLSQYVDQRDTSGEPPQLLGVGRMLVRPTFFQETLDVSTTLDSRTSAERAKDLQGLLVNKVRDLVYRMYVQSGFKAASDAMFGVNAEPPVVVIGTDQELARYLQVDGDLRTVGPDFQVKVVHTVDARMKGKIAVAFSYANGGEAAQALNFGNMLWKPELTTVLPITRNGQVSKELTVMPSFLHIVNCPVMSMLTVTGLQNVVASKVAVATDII